MGESRISIRHMLIEPRLEIVAGGWVGILLDQDARRCVTNEHGAEAVSDAGISHHATHFVGDLVKASAGSRDRDALNHQAHSVS